MKKFEKTKGFILGVVITLLFVGGITAIAKADTVWRDISVAYDNYKVVLDGVNFEPKDSSGKLLEPFSYEGWIYVPFEHVAKALGKDTYWDGNTHTLYLGARPANTGTPVQTETKKVEQTVYWVPKGSVYHLSRSCSTLSRSKDIRSGTIAESGMPRACKVCG